jgi:hypothetical protein
MVDWLEEHGCFVSVSVPAMATGDIGTKINALV